MAKKQEKISFQEAKEELEDIIKQLENQELPVDQLTETTKRATVLFQICKDKLHSTETEVETILKSLDED